MYEDQKAQGRIQTAKSLRGKSNAEKIATTAALVVIVIVIIAYLAFSWHSVPVVSSNQTISLALGKSSYFKLKGQSVTFAMFLENSSSSYATIYMSEVPVLTSPVSEFTVYNGSQVNVSTSLSSIANLAVRLVYSGNALSKVELMPIPAVYKIPASTSIVISNPASFYSGTATQSVTTPTSTASTPSGTQSSSTGKSSSNTSGSSPLTSTSTTTSTTTASRANTALENISSILNYTYMGSLMYNYKSLYSSDKACTAPEYNTSLLESTHQSPNGPLDFSNVSALTPTGLIVNATPAGKNNYIVTYSPIVSNSELHGIAVSFNLNSSTAVITNLKFSGIYQGLNYTSLLGSYRYQKGLGVSCAALIP